MPGDFSFEDLEIVGHADNRSEWMRPAVVPPVFHIAADPAKFLLPPFRLDGAKVLGATVASEEEVLQLRDTGQLTLFPAPIGAPRSGYELWLTRDGEIKYQPSPEVRRQLRNFAADAVQLAVSCLREGQLERAESAASEAILCDDRRVDPLAIKAAIRRLQNNPDGERLMAELASSQIEQGLFEAAVAHLTSLARPLPAVPFPAALTQIAPKP